MKISVVEIVQRRIYLRRMLLGLTILFPFVAIGCKFLLGIKFRLDVVLYPFFGLVVLYICSIYFYKVYRIIGSVIFSDDYLTVDVPKIEPAKRVAYAGIGQLVFTFSDSKDDFNGVSLKPTTGINNYIAIDDEQLHVLVESSQDQFTIEYYFGLLAKRGINAKVVQAT